MSCQHNNPPGYAFCSTCGEPLDILRCRCGFANLRNSRYCGQCGMELARQDAVSAVAASVGKYNLDEFITTVTIEKKQEDKRLQEQQEAEEKSNAMSQDDIASLFGNLKDEGE